MGTAKIVKKHSTVTCPDCGNSFKVNIGNENARWQNFIFKCPVCNEMKCVSRSEITE